MKNSAVLFFLQSLVFYAYFKFRNGKNNPGDVTHVNLQFSLLHPTISLQYWQSISTVIGQCCNDTVWYGMVFLRGLIYISLSLSKLYFPWWLFHNFGNDSTDFSMNSESVSNDDLIDFLMRQNSQFTLLVTNI